METGQHASADETPLFSRERFAEVPLTGLSFRYSCQADTGTQLQNRLRSPWTLSTRPTGGQYFRRSIPGTGNAASSRV
jgi:hypothetical protein